MPVHQCINVFYCDECIQDDRVAAREDTENEETEHEEEEIQTLEANRGHLVFRFEHFRNFIPPKVTDLEKKPIYGIWWMKDNEMGWRFMTHKVRSQAFYNDIEVKNHEIGAKYMCMRDPEEMENEEELKALQIEPIERGLQEHIDFLKDRAHMMRFLESPTPPPDPDDVNMYYRLYWIDEMKCPGSGKLYHDVDTKK